MLIYSVHYSLSCIYFMSIYTEPNYFLHNDQKLPSCCLATKTYTVLVMKGLILVLRVELSFLHHYGF